VCLPSIGALHAPFQANHPHLPSFLFPTTPTSRLTLKRVYIEIIWIIEVLLLAGARKRLSPVRVISWSKLTRAREKVRMSPATLGNALNGRIGGLFGLKPRPRPPPTTSPPPPYHGPSSQFPPRLPPWRLPQPPTPTTTTATRPLASTPLRRRPSYGVPPRPTSSFSLVGVRGVQLSAAH